MTDDRIRAANPGVDIGALLRVALEQGPRDDVQDRVLGRMVTMTTVMEFARLIFVAPVQWIIDEHLRAPAHEGEEDEHAGVDE
jgi:hypothetical protein